MAAMSLIVLLSGCVGDATTSTVDLTEFHIDGPASLSEGAQTLDVVNNGEFPHTLVVTDHDGRVVATTDLLQPGESVELGFDVGQGVYQFTCRIVTQIEGGEIVDHFEEGMSAIVQVG